VEAEYGHDFSKTVIVASNDINESVIHALNRQGHEIDVYGIGTHLVTCQAQPALGCVFKLVEIGNTPRIKLSSEAAKITIPGKKRTYRLLDATGVPLMDYITRDSEPVPAAGSMILCRHPFIETKRVYVKPSQVVPLLEVVWDGRLVDGIASDMEECRSYLAQQITGIREDHLRSLNPTPYKVSVSEQLYNFLHELMESEAPIQVIQ
jgi:nicotinate phosphoribosyltransferase